MDRSAPGADRDGRRPLLRDGSRQAVGADQARLRRDRRRRRRSTHAASPIEAVQPSYDAGVTDEFVKPVVIVDADSAPVGPIRDGDSVIFFNFRADRARQLTRAIALDDFDGFERPDRPRVHYTTMTVYDRTFNLPVAFQPQTFSGNLADVLAEHGRTNLRLAETEKYAHVTYFFNCGREEPYPGEDRMLVPSQKVATYDLMPEMSAPGITDALVDDIVARPPRRRDLQLRERRHGRAHRPARRDDRRRRNARRVPRTHHDALPAGRRHARSSPPTTATPSRCGTTQLNAPHTAHTSNPVPVILCDDRLAGTPAARRHAARRRADDPDAAWHPAVARDDRLVARRGVAGNHAVRSARGPSAATACQPERRPAFAKATRSLRFGRARRLE